ncbi:hypothetical protein [Enterovirga rhinocerotis]|uniref:Uncharacterized protein n=1 Tax=Enterovirga rhinocerotis TaxID=1339210 RepID=A0A4R7C831_9HYPH|nr:hypothetical protein [Enterovirga rhinocerotis]TDR94363.1 hypothetical protein EV668_1649 [Enterovirga rhinocerotis]
MALNLPPVPRDQPFEPGNETPGTGRLEGVTNMIGIGRIAIAAAIMTACLVVAESHGARAGTDGNTGTGPASSSPGAPSEAGSAAADPACPRVKVVYAGHGEAERSPCRPASR